MRRTRYLALVIACAALAACGNARREHPLFELMSPRRTGVTFANTITTTDSENIQSDYFVYNGGGVAVGDVDNDGDPDILLLGVGEPPRLLRNDGGNRNHWLGVRLEGTRGNRDGVGALVRVTAEGKERVQVRAGGTSYASASDPRLLFGLGSAAEAQRLEVRWPGGEVSVLTGLPANRYVTVREDRE